MNTPYKEQAQMIKLLVNEITNKSDLYAEVNDNPYYDDLEYVINKLKKIDHFLSENYIKK